MRVAVNRVLTATVLPLALAHIVAVSRFRPHRVRAVARGWVARLTRITGVRLEVAGRPCASGEAPTVLVANHSSFLDIAALIVAAPDLTFVAGADLFRIPLLAGAMRALGTVPVDRRSGGGTRIELPPGFGGSTLAVFPEGGIPPAGTRRPFKRGAFALAIDLGADVLPVAIHGSDTALPPGGWLGVRPGCVTVEYLAPMSTEGLAAGDRYRLAAAAEEAILAALRRPPLGSSSSTPPSGTRSGRGSPGGLRRRPTQNPVAPATPTTAKG